ncbi:hypothetical protein V7068_22240 [Bacillus sp. JJ634]
MKTSNINCLYCAHYNSINRFCMLEGTSRNAPPIPSSRCVKENNYVRYIFVVRSNKPHYSSQKYFSQFKKDDLGRPLYVITNRGIEHPLKAGPLVHLKNFGNGVPRIFTFQGQRELIYEIGFTLTLIEGYKYNVPVYCYKYEKNIQGQANRIKTYLKSNSHIINHLTNQKKLNFKYYLIKDKLSEYIDNNFNLV